MGRVDDMKVSQAKELRGRHRKRILPFTRVLVRVRSVFSKPAGHSVDVPSAPVVHYRRSEHASSVGAILPTVSEVPHVKDASSYWRRLQSDPAFAEEMSERQRKIGQWPR